MATLLLSAGLFLFVSYLCLISFRRLSVQWRVRRRIRNALRHNRLEIRLAKTRPDHLLQIYRHVYDSALFESQSIRFKSPARREQYISDELNRMIRHPLLSAFFSLMVLVKGLFAILLLVMSFSIGAVMLDEFKTAPLALPSLSQAEEAIDAFLVSDDHGPSFTFKNETAAVSPLFQESGGTYPEHVMNAKQLGQAMSYHMKAFEPRFQITYQGNPQGFEQTFKRAVSWTERNDPYHARTIERYAYQYVDHGTHVECEVTMKYRLTKEENALVNGKIKQIAKSMPKGLSDFEKVKYVNDYIVHHTAYNLKSKASPYTPYSILLNGEGVCEGYALSSLLLLKELGIEAQYISGTARGELHAWNLVKLDGKWYHLDTTWNDPIPDRGNVIGYDYFLIPDERMKKDHKWNEADFPKTAEAAYL